jgi:glycosyltransferase involved in cell wall biosynthesis
VRSLESNQLLYTKVIKSTLSEETPALIMKALLVSTFDLYGGAARAAYRLHQGLRTIDVDAQMLVQVKQSDSKHIVGGKADLATAQISHGSRTLLNQLPVKFYPKRSGSLFSPQWLYDGVVKKIDALNPDVVNLHWTSGGYLQIESATKIKQPVIWTLHDMWAFTGGCHYNQECNRYHTSCGACPQLGSAKDADLSRRIWQRKDKAWKNHRFIIVALSHWMADSIKQSALLKSARIEVIPNGLDTTKYRPFDSQLARNILGLPNHKKLLLTGSLDASSEKRKGAYLLLAALQELQRTAWRDDLELVVLGSSNSEQAIDLGFKVNYLGVLHDDYSIALAYSAVDAFVAPSLQDNLPNTIMESLACGTPCVAFNIGGMPDMIEHCKNGYLAKPYQIDDLAQGLVWVLKNQEHQQNLADRARQKVEQEFSQEIQARRYESLFSTILNK